MMRNKKGTEVLIMKKNRKLKTMIVTMLICVMMLSATTYAWFRLTNSPSVSELSLKAGTTGTLEIGKTSTGTFSDSVDLTEAVAANSCLKPLTTVNGKTFYKPVYSSNGKVISIESTALTPAELTAITNKSETEGGYIVQTKFFLKASTSEDKSIDIKLAGAGITGTTSTDGTIIKNTGSSDSAAASIRISFATTSETAVLEPNADLTVTGREAQTSMTGWDSLNTIKEDSNYKFKNNGSTGY